MFHKVPVASLCVLVGVFIIIGTCKRPVPSSDVPAADFGFNRSQQVIHWQGGLF